MRIRIVQKPSVACIDGIQLNHFVPGQQYEVGPSLGSLFLAEGWAEPAVPNEPPAPSDEPSNVVDPVPAPANLVREIYPPYYDGPSVLAADRRRRKRRPVDR